MHARWVKRASLLSRTVNWLYSVSRQYMYYYCIFVLNKGCRSLWYSDLYMHWSPSLAQPLTILSSVQTWQWCYYWVLHYGFSIAARNRGKWNEELKLFPFFPTWHHLEASIMESNYPKISAALKGDTLWYSWIFMRTCKMGGVVS